MKNTVCPLCGIDGLKYVQDAQVERSISKDLSVKNTGDLIIYDNHYVECSNCYADNESSAELDAILRAIKQEPVLKIGFIY